MISKKKLFEKMQWTKLNIYIELVIRETGYTAIKPSVGDK